MDTAGCSLAGLVSEFWQCGLAGARFGQNTKVLGESAGRDRSQARLCCVSVQGLLKAEGRKCRKHVARGSWKTKVAWVLLLTPRHLPVSPACGIRGWEEKGEETGRQSFPQTHSTMPSFKRAGVRSHPRPVRLSCSGSPPAPGLTASTGSQGAHIGLWLSVGLFRDVFV